MTLKLTPSDLAALPPEVRAEHEALERQLAGERVEPEPEPVAPQEDAQEPPAPEPATEPEPEPAPSTEVSANAPPADTPSTDQQIAELQHKIAVLQGKLDKEVPRYARENRVLKEQIRELEEQLAQPAPAPQPTISPATHAGTDPDNPYGLTPGQLEYGPEIIEMAVKIAEQIVDRKVPEYLRPTEQRLQQTAKQTFHEQLTASAPNWQSLNTDQGFLGWLEEEQPLTGETRWALFDRAAQNLDARRVAAFFTTYEQEMSRTATPPATMPTAAPRPKPSLQSQVGPTPSLRPPASPMPPPSMTFEEWQAASDALAQQAPTLPPSEFAKRKAKLDAAYKAGFK